MSDKPKSPQRKSAENIIRWLSTNDTADKETVIRKITISLRFAERRGWNACMEHWAKNGDRCNFYFGGFDGGNRCQKKRGHPENENEGHEWVAKKER